jgi:3',5'-cyclic-AMP phosphodiesterase
MFAAASSRTLTATRRFAFIIAMIIAQISDFHIRAGGKPLGGHVDTARALERCVAHLGALVPAPDVVLATGDLVDDESDAAYGLLLDILSPLKMPVLPIPGNHDGRAALLRAFARHAHVGGCGDRVRYLADDWPVRLIALDTLVPGATHGALDSDDVAWLGARLAEAPQRPTLVFLHHPPFATGMPAMDALGLRVGAAALGDVVARHPQVERIVAGHVHRSIQTRWRGTLASTAPSTAHQIVLDLRPDAVGAYTFEPPGHHLHVWTGDALVTHLVPIGSFPGPFPFGKAGTPPA